MAEQDDARTDVGAPETYTNGADPAAGGPAIGLISQYIKDVSFENPNAPAIFQTQAAPGIDVQFNIAANQVAEEVHEVTLKIDVRAEVEGQVAFIVDLSYAGLFGVRQVPAEHLQPFMLGEAPRLLFPFARRVLADAVRDGGFPPLLLEPIDFGQLYLQQAEAQQGGQPGAVGTA